MTSQQSNPLQRVALCATLIAVVVVFAARPDTSAAHYRPPGIGQQLAIPSYIHPTLDPDAWLRISASAPGSVGITVANVINGPDYMPFGEWASVIRTASSSGVKVVGYVDTGYLGTTGQRTRLGSTDVVDWMSQIQRDIAAWYKFYGVDLAGIFFDQTQNSCGPTPDSNDWADLYRFLSEGVKRLHPGALTVYNPGIGVPECYADGADVIVTFEGSYASYIGDADAPNPYTGLSWDPVDPKKIWHIVYGAADVMSMTHAVALSKTRSAGYVYVTDDVLANPYDELPPPDYWGAEQAIVTELPLGWLMRPSQPATLDTVEVYSTSIVLDWEASKGRRAPVVAYDVYRDGVRVGSVPANKLTYTAVNLDPLTTYTFAVVARDALGTTSEASDSLTVATDETYGDPRQAPAEFAATATTFTSARLSWQPSQPDPPRPDIEAYVILQNGREILRLPGTVDAVSVGGLAPDATYAFTVFSVDASGDRTPETASLSVTTPALPDGATIGHYSVVETPESFSYSAEFLVPFAFRRVFISTADPASPCWSTGSEPPICADYLLENDRLLKYAGTGLDWEWTIVKEVVAARAGFIYTWTISPADIGSPTTALAIFNASGYAPNSYCGAVIACTITGPPLPYE